MAMTPWEPIDEFMDEALSGFTPLRRAMNRLIEESFIRPTVVQPFRQLFPLDMRDTDSEYVIEASIPGVKPDEIRITTAENTLTIQASHKSQREEKDEKAGRYVRRELYQGEVSRTVRLPGPIDADKIAATYEHGMLTLHVPKAPAAKAKQITVQVKESDKPAS